MPQSEKSEKSLNWIIAALMVVVAAFGWGFMAGSYSGSAGTTYDNGNSGPRTISEVRREGKGVFIMNALVQLPNMPAVISWHFSNRVWLPILIVLLEVGVFFGGIGAKRLEKQLEDPRSRRR